MKIREIRQKVPDGQNRLKIILYKDKVIIVADFVDSFDRFGGREVRFEVTPRRIKQLADDVLNALGKKAKMKEWKPTFYEFEKKLEERYREEGVYMWLIDWARNPENKKEAKRIYEWLQLADDMGMFNE